VPKDTWLNFLTYSKAYNIFSLLPDNLINNKVWPDLAAYNANHAIKNHQNMSIHFVPQAKHANSFDCKYEPKIYLTGEVQTRCENWHDFFNMLIWRIFPKIKSALNAQHYQALLKRQGLLEQRSRLENYLTLFDEGGIIICSSDDELLAAIQSMSWKELFWTHRKRLVENLRCFVFGHALHEKLLKPYIGLVGHALLIKKTAHFLNANLENQLHELNENVSRLLFNLSDMTSPKDLFPVPILGFPDWVQETHREVFYDNHTYFRSCRAKSV
jgi:hypothetical protein